MGGGDQGETWMHSHLHVSPYPCIRATNSPKLTEKALGAWFTSPAKAAAHKGHTGAGCIWSNLLPWHEPIPNILTLSSPKPMCFHRTSPRLPGTAPSASRGQISAWNGCAQHTTTITMPSGQCNGTHGSACGVDPSNNFTLVYVNSELDLLMTFSLVLPQGQILHRYILLLMQSRESHLASTGTSSPGAWPWLWKHQRSCSSYRKKLRSWPQGGSFCFIDCVVVLFWKTHPTNHSIPDISF